jgi:hypothetical protein
LSSSGIGRGSSRRRIARWLPELLLAFAIAVLWGSGPATASYPVEGRFHAERACPAFQSFRRETNPGGVTLLVGHAYEAVSLNREGGDHVLLEIEAAIPSRRWVSLTCGRLDTGSESASAPTLSDERHHSPVSSGQLRPFFDRRDAGESDPTPHPPSLTAFDRAVLDLCGGWGSRPSRTRFRQMLEHPDLAADVAQLRDELDHAVRGAPLSPARFADELTALWFAEDGFRHVFCGEPREERLGGLHFKGRFLQMQERGWGGLAACGQAEIDPPIYTIGVEYTTPSGQLELACPKSYSTALDARALLVEATRAFRAQQAKRPGEAMCVHEVGRSESRSHLAVLVSRAGAIRTFYPHASPTCDRRRPPEQCLCGG